MRAVLTALLLLGISPLVLLAQTAPPADGTIIITLLTSDTNKPARGARVFINVVNPRDVSAAASDEGVTGIDGKVTLHDVKPGTYSIDARLTGYSLPRPTDSADAHRPIEIRPGQTTLYSLTLDRLASIAGHALYSDGSPVINASVFFQHIDEQPLVWHLSASTDDRGFFRKNYLRPGRFLVAVSPPFSTGLPSDRPPRRAALVYSPQTFHRAEATIYTLARGEDLTGVLVEVPLAPLHTLTGSLVSSDGHPFNQGSVTLADTADPSFKVSADIIANVNPARFVFAAIPTGTYTLHAETGFVIVDADPISGDDRNTTYGAETGTTTVVLDQSDIDNLVITLHPDAASPPPPGSPEPSKAPEPSPDTAEILGTLTLEDTRTPARGASVRLSAQPQTDKSASYEAAVSVNGAFSFPSLPPGVYVLEPHFIGYDLDQSSSKASVLRIDLHAGETVARNLLLERGASLSGRALYTDGVPVIDSGVAVHTLDGHELPLQTLVRTDDRGDFYLSGLPSGTFTVAVTPPVANLIDEENASFQHLLIYSPGSFHQRTATRFTLHPGEAIDGIRIDVPVGSLHSIAGGVSSPARGHPLVGSIVLTDITDPCFRLDPGLAENGSFLFPAVPPGTYTLTAEGVFFAPQASPTPGSGLPPILSPAHGTRQIVVRDHDIADLVLEATKAEALSPAKPCTP